MFNDGRFYFLLSLFLLIFLFVFKDNSFLYPFFNYITVIHEMCHAIMAIITGGNVYSITLNKYGGVTTTSGGIFTLISLFGYIGTTIIGSLLIYFSKNNFISNYLLKGLSLLIFIIYLLNYKIEFNFQLIVLVCMNIFVFFISYFTIRNIFSLILGNILILDSINDVKIYLLNTNIIYDTDAGILARHFGSELFTFPIAIFLFIFNMIILYILIKNLIKNNDTKIK